MCERRKREKQETTKCRKITHKSRNKKIKKEANQVLKNKDLGLDANKRIEKERRRIERITKNSEVGIQFQENDGSLKSWTIFYKKVCLFKSLFPACQKGIVGL